MTYDIQDILAHLDPGRLTYQDWVNVGMALKDEGLSCADWDTWSSHDPARYHTGECERKWKTFSGAANPVTAGTIVQLARDQGYNPPRADDYALDWDAEIGRDDDRIIDHNWIESRDVPAPPEGDDWHPAKQLIRYLELLFEASENGRLRHRIVVERGKGQAPAHVRRIRPHGGRADRGTEQV